MNRCEHIRTVLRDGPSTVSEIAITLRIPLHRAKVGIWIMRREGMVRPIGELPSGAYPQKIYELIRETTR